MKLDELVIRIEKIAPSKTELQFDRIGIIKKQREDVYNIGVCVDLTAHTAKIARFKGLDFLVVHNGFGEQTIETAAANSFGAYGTHLALDTAPDGLIDTLGHTLGFIDLEPIILEYKGNKVPNGAALARFSPRTYEAIETHASIAGEYSSQRSRFDLKAQGAAYKLDSKTCLFDKAVISTGDALREDFFAQMLGHCGNEEEQISTIFIAGSAAPKVQKRASEKGIAILTLGNYESHVPGMQRFAQKLHESLKPYRASAVFVPSR